MKWLHITLALLIATLLSVLARQGFSGSSDAALTPTRKQAPATDQLAARSVDCLPAATIQMAQHSSSTVDEDAEMLLARLAAGSGTFLLDRARRYPDRPILLQQAIAHLRASLAHEETLHSGTTLFQEVREKLAQAEKLLASRSSPTITPSRPPMEPTPALNQGEAITTQAPTPSVQPPVVGPTPSKQELAPPALPEVGPDGVIFQRDRSSDNDR